MSKTIGVVGFGTVGKAIYNFFKDHWSYSVLVNDPSRIAEGMIHPDHVVGFGRIKTCDVVFICVPTLSGLDGRCDISIVEEVAGQLASGEKALLVIVKSTVEPGTTDYLAGKYGLSVVFSPEFCGESSYWSPYKWDRDLKEMPYFIFGGDSNHTSRAVDLYMRVGGPTKKYLQTTAMNAEMVKYVSNAFAATKVTFCNEVYEMCRKIGLDYNEIRELWLNDPRVNPMHTAVFEENGDPFGGKCLPKDLLALVNWSIDSVGYFPDLLGQVLHSNERIGMLRKKEK